MQTLEAQLSPTNTLLQGSDADLIQRMAAGDEVALRRLYAAYGQRMFAFALRLAGDPASAEEAVQESLVAAWQGAKRFRAGGRAPTRLLGIVHHKALNQLRRQAVASLDDGKDE